MTEHDNPHTAPDWPALRAKAINARANAYSPYSKFPVGAAGLCADGRVVTGCNVENASYGLGLCAECVLVGNFVASGGGHLIAVTVTGPRPGALMPCGRCRQVLLEHGGPQLLIDAEPAPVTVAELLPHAFSAQDLP